MNKKFMSEDIENAWNSEFDSAAADWFEDFIAGRIDQWRQVAAKCESPIESRLLAAMLFGSFGYNRVVGDGVMLVEAFEPREWHSKRGDVFIVPQAQIAQFRVDFVVYAGDLCGGWIPVAIECDGHAFHEKTKEQAARDKKRDRSIASMGMTVLRFTGSEIFASAESCVEQISSVLVPRIQERLHLAGHVEKAASQLPEFRSADEGEA